MVLADNTASNNYGSGISVSHSVDTILRDNVASDNLNYGLDINYSDNTVIYNGIYDNNGDYGIWSTSSYETWNVDGVASLSGNDAHLDGHIYVMDGGQLTLASGSVQMDYAADHTVLIYVYEGGLLKASNAQIFCVESNGLFQIYGEMAMTSCNVNGWYETYLAPTSAAKISASSFFNSERYGLHIDNCAPVVTSSVFYNNYLAGMFIEGKKASPSIEKCVFFLNPRCIYAVNADLGDVVGNIFAVNTEAGIYGNGVSGTIAGNSFVLNKVEIYLASSSVTISDNEIGWSHLIDVAAEYSPVASIIVNYLSEMTDITIDVATPTVAYSPTDMASYVAALLVNHNGIMAADSVITCHDNTYGLVSWALFAENCTVVFGDDVSTSTLQLVWLNSNFVQKTLDFPLKANGGIYARSSHVTVTGATIDVLDTAVYLSGSNATISDSFLLADQYDIYAVGDSNVELSGTVLDGQVKAIGDAQVTAEFQLDILTTDSKGNIITGVTVTVKNAQGVVVATGKSDATGHFKCSVVAYVIVNGNMDDSMNPYKVTAGFYNGDVTSSVTMTDATSMTIAAQVDNTAAYVGIIAVVAVIFIIAAAVLLRRKN